MRRAAASLMVMTAALMPWTQLRAQEHLDFQKYTASPDYRALIDKALASLPPEVFQKCPSLVSPPSTVTVAAPITMGPDGLPKTGAWWQRFPVSGCGNDTTLNLNFSVRADGKIVVTVALPGTTHADLTLQHDGLFYATVGAGTRAKSCKTFIVKNTRFESYGSHDHPTHSPAQGQFQPWWESWVVTGCGRTFNVPMDFSPDATGTQITQRSQTITEL